MPEVPFKLPRGFLLEDPEDAGALAELKAGLPRSAQRRMTLMGLMVHRMLEDRPLGEETAIVYATAFGESRAMERYIGSFPIPSPMGFQSSIHPSGVEQSLILRKQPVRFFLPVAGLEAIFQVMQSAGALPSESILIGAEERGSWLAEHGLSCRHTYAWAVTTAAADEAEGVFSWERNEAESATEGDLGALSTALIERSPWQWRRPGLGTITLRWK